MQYREDFNSLVGSSEDNTTVNRRSFIQTAVGVGFAAAVAPVCAQTMIKTDRVGLTDGVTKLNVAGAEVPMYFVKPEGKINLPVILVISEIFGVHEHIADVARRFAKQGYLALAPELFVRQGDAKNAESVAVLIKEIISKVPDAQVMGDLDAAVAWAGNNGGDIKRLGITGFCWGGRITWMYSAYNPSVKAGVAWYGKLLGDASALTPKHPIDIASGLKTPVLGLYGAKDQGIPVESVFKMEVELKKGNSKSEFKVYENSGHAFNADYRPSYNEADAKDGWNRCLAWFKANGVV
ncbi:dienelactone hydrolase family protein [Undibacterium sp. CY18W]|uniref:Dienelactone hydrolase family protein n=1 Tax=Undibacterium hunanense TaxID=2762292 RepID=A0ABR6ZPW0_9BURK|nr:dienelactone hydrolase family protein [Undibacterium hunanense]MBC3917624.1 dienelactone hydrolase family protein [Undibacterium hunanense]